jgi:hypothetical protein
LLKPGMTSSEYIHALEQNKQSVDAVKALAHGMPERDSVSWACQSSQKVADKLNPEEKAASHAAEAWTKNPTPANKAAAAEAASKTDFKGPGGWAAQAAAWTQSPAAPAAPAATGAGASAAPAVAGAPAAPAAPALTAAAVVGSILLAAGLSNQPPMSAPQKPDFESLPVRPQPQPQVPAPAQPEIPPLDQSKMAKSLQPFIDLGKQIASGKGALV